MTVSKSKASDYFTAGLILLVSAVIIWLLENFILNGKVDNIVLFIVPIVFVVLSITHLAVAGTKLYSSRSS